MVVLEEKKYSLNYERKYDQRVRRARGSRDRQVLAILRRSPIILIVILIKMKIKI